MTKNKFVDILIKNDFSEETIKKAKLMNSAKEIWIGLRDFNELYNLCASINKFKELNKIKKDFNDMQKFLFKKNNYTETDKAKNKKRIEKYQNDFKILNTISCQKIRKTISWNDVEGVFDNQ